MQRRTLVRAANLATFRGALVDHALGGGPLATRRRVVIVPSRASAELLRQTMEQRVLAAGGPGLVCPDLVTRDEWLARFHAALPAATRWLTPTERFVLFERAARAAVTLHRFDSQPFRLRPGLVAAMLTFHDEVRRRGRTVSRMARVLFDELRVERGTDKGSESLIDQTRFLAFTFLAYARAVDASGGLDEHALRTALVAAQPRFDVDEVVVAVADHPADPRGLWPADFDLLGRLAHLAHITVVMTDEAHDAGFRERLELELPGIEEARAETIDWQPRVLRPVGADLPVFDSRDREEELREVARTIRARADVTDGSLAGPVAVVFHRPLPYLYLAQQVMTDARVPYQAFDALPLAGEPHAALVDLALTVARTDGARAAVMALLRSPLIEIPIDGRAVTLGEVRALDRVLAERRALGDARSFVGEVEAAGRAADQRRAHDVTGALRAARAAARVVSELEPCRAAPTASAQVGALVAFLQSHEVAVSARSDPDSRGRRARRAVRASLVTAAEAFERHDDPPRSPEALAALLHHVIEGQTFAPARSHAGVHLVDAAAARFGGFDDVYLVGLVETDWAERPRRNVFYASTLLRDLGWPQDQDHVRAQQAAFRDVLTLARSRTRLSAFQLDGETVVNRSTMIDAVVGLPTEDDVPAVRQPLFADERLTGRVGDVSSDEGLGEWLRWRSRRPALGERAYAGFVAARPAETYRVSRVERYITCPFKYFAENVLRLPEDRDELAGLTPLERGTLVHAIFERFYREWQAAGHGAITADNLPEAEALFGRIATEAIAGLPRADRLLEEMRLLGSAVGPGLADRVFVLEMASGRGVRERLVEQELFGSFTFPLTHGLETRAIEIRGKTDRIDVLDDGSLRVVDYKLGRMPDLETSVQIGVYAHCAQQWLEERDGRPHPVSAAMYLAFGDEKRFDGQIAKSSAPVALVVHEKASLFADTVSRIESGEFPPRPRTPSECLWCGYAAVCRKEYQVEGDDDAADAV